MTAEEKPGSSGYIPEIDSLRAFAVLSVLAFHLDSAWLPGGFSGVDVFFVISGYVVSSSLNAHAREGFGRFALGFYAKRMLRIAPALVACLLFTTAVTVLFVPESWLSGNTYDTIAFGFLGLGNLPLINGHDAYFSPRIDFNMAAHTWSLAVEEQFYLAFPVLFYARTNFQAWRPSLRYRHRNSVAVTARQIDTADQITGEGREIPSPHQRGLGISRSVQLGRGLGRCSLIALTCASLIFSAIATGKAPLSAYYSLFSRFWELGLGALLFQEHRSGRLFCGTAQSALAPLAAGALLVVGVFCSKRELFPVPWALCATFGSALYIAYAASPALRNAGPRRTLRWPPLIFVGKCSYSLYLWHWPVFALFRWTCGLESAVARTVAVCLVSLASVASYRFLENPIRRSAKLQALPPRPLVLSGIASLGACALLCYALLKLGQPHLSLSVTRDERDWQSDDWYTKGAFAKRACHEERFSEPLGNGEIITMRRVGCADQAPMRRLFVLGDSHALAYFALLSHLVYDEPLQVSVYFKSGCPFLNLAEPMHDLSPACFTFARDVARDVAAHASPSDVIFLPSLRLKRFGDAWAGFQENATLQAMNGPKAQVARAAAIIDADEWLSGLERSGASLIFEAPTPIFKAPAFRCADWFNRVNPTCAPGLTMDRGFVEDYRMPVVRALQELAARHKRMRLWDPFPLLCPGTTCSALRNGRPLFLDGDHLSGYGNEVVYASFRAFLE